MSDNHTKPASYRPPVSIALTVAVFIGAQVAAATVFSLLVLLVSGPQGLTGAEAEARLQQNPWLYSAVIGLMAVFTVLGIRFVMNRIGMSFRDIGFGRFRGEHILYAFAGYGAALVLAGIALTVVKRLVAGIDLQQEQALGLPRTADGSDLVALFVALVIVPPLIEELIMRGFLFTNLRRHASFWVAAVMVSVLFGLMHITQATDALFWTGAISFFVLSMVLCWLREKTDSIWPCIGVHMLQNGIAFMALYVWKVA